MNNRRYGMIATGAITVDAAWQLCSCHEHIKADFEEQTLRPLQLDSWWAYWFARHVITDRWECGERLINLDNDVLRRYVQYVETLKAVGCYGHTLIDNEDFIVDTYNTIIKWKPGRGPKIVKRTSLFDCFGVNEAAAVADRIAQEMQEFQKQRKLRKIDSHKDNANED